MRYHKKSGLTSSLLAATLLAACIACMGSCTSDGCYDNGSAVPLAKFYNSGTGSLPRSTASRCAAWVLQATACWLPGKV